MIRVICFIGLYGLVVGVLSAQITARPLRSSLASDQASFVKVPAERTGVSFVSPLIEDHPHNYLYHSGFACGGVCIGDVNGDTVPDLFFVNGPGANALYLQDAKKPWTFTEVADGLGLGGGEAWGTGAAMVDIDNDGDLDLYVCNYRSANQLFINESVPSGRLAFRESAASFGLDMVNACLMPAFADYDRDGDLDVFILNNRVERPGGRPEKPPYSIVDGKPQVLPEYAPYYQLQNTDGKNFRMDSYGQPDRLLRNDGGTFVDVTQKAGVLAYGHGLSATWWDYNKDGYPDLYVGNDFIEPDRLFRNQHDGTFKEVLGDTMPHCSWSSMGADSADLNNDGWPDFLSADMAATTHFKQKVNMGDMSRYRTLMESGWPRQMMRNMLYVNTGADRFMETAFLSGVANTDWTWAVKLADYDCDGLVDVFFSNGMARNFSDADIPMSPEMLVGRTEWDIYRSTPPMREKNLVFRNEGDLQFANVSAEWKLDEEGISYGAAYGDIDLDGDPDLVVMNLGDSPSLFENRVASGHAVTVSLKGRASNRMGLGATVTLTAGGLSQMRYMNPYTGFQSSNAPEVHFGLGSATLVESVVVDWPSGQRQTLTSLKEGQHYEIEELETSVAKTPALAKQKAMFVERSADNGLLFTHQEAPYDDYLIEPLLPAKLSQLGPGMAWGDVNGDGLEDVFAGGAKGQAGSLFVQDQSHRFTELAGPWNEDRDCEDMGVLWLDADRDGDLDLYVASGSNEYPLGSRYYQDRLYLNEGSLTFRRAKDALPALTESSSVVIAGDVDRDGDLDLFVGSRSIPGHFPESPSSHFLRNDSTAGKPRFEEATEEMFPGLGSMGLVTSALWTDIDQDGWLDLLVVSEWGLPRSFRNDAGKRFVEQTAESGVGDLSAWWNSVAGGDVDGDGDMDYLVMNAGLNTKYGHPSSEKPSYLYYGDMDGTGTKQLIEAKAGAEGLLPIRGRSCSSRAMPFIAKKFENFRSFASSDLEEIYTQPRLEQAETFTVTELASGILLNDSKPGTIAFRWSPLPRMAQASPGYGAAIQDIDGDGKSDIVFAGNLYTREPETGLWRGLPGMILKGEGKGTFSPMNCLDSGFMVPGDGKGLAIADLNGDSRPDLIAVQNNDRLLAFERSASVDFLEIVLRGPLGNPTGVGARVHAQREKGVDFTQEISAGSGYLSQSSARVFVSKGGGSVKEIKIVWPNGKETVEKGPFTGNRLVLEP